MQFDTFIRNGIPYRRWYLSKFKVQILYLYLSELKMFLNAFAADDFWKHCCNRGNCSWWAISSFATMFPNLFNNTLSKIFLYRCSICLTNSVNPFPHTTILQQTTLNVFCQNIEKLHNWMDNLWLEVENIVAKGEIARIVQFLLLSLCFQKFVCCRGFSKRLYEGKG